MSATLSFGPMLTGTGSYNAASPLTQLASQINLGVGFGALLPNLSYGNATTYANNTLLANDWLLKSYTITAGSTQSINMNTGSDKNPFGVDLAWTFLKMVVVAMQSPDGAAHVQVGPQGVANAAQLWFGGVGATVYDAVYFTHIWSGPAVGWTITNGTACILPIKNPGASSVTVAVFLAGGS